MQSLPPATEAECLARGDVPWTDWAGNPIIRCCGIGWQIDRNEELLRACVCEGEEFVQRFGLPCTDERAAKILAEQRNFQPFSGAEADELADWIEKDGWESWDTV